MIIGCSPGQLGDWIPVADLDLPRDIGTGQSELAVQMAAIQGFVASSGEGAGACERGSRRKGLSAHDVDGDDVPDPGEKVESGPVYYGR